jgi:hypothetical protein
MTRCRVAPSLPIVPGHESAGVAASIEDPDVFISDWLPLAGYAGALALFERGEGHKIQVLP